MFPQHLAIQKSVTFPTVEGPRSLRRSDSGHYLRCFEPVRNIRETPAASKHWVEETYGHPGRNGVAALVLPQRTARENFSLLQGPWGAATSSIFALPAMAVAVGPPVSTCFSCFHCHPPPEENRKQPGETIQFLVGILGTWKTCTSNTTPSSDEIIGSLPQDVQNLHVQHGFHHTNSSCSAGALSFTARDLYRRS